MLATFDGIYFYNVNFPSKPQLKKFVSKMRNISSKSEYKKNTILNSNCFGLFPFNLHYQIKCRCLLARFYAILFKFNVRIINVNELSI